MKRVINGKTYSKTIGVKKGELAVFGDNGELNASGVKAEDISSFPEGGSVGDVLTKGETEPEWAPPVGGSSISYSDITVSITVGSEAMQSGSFKPPEEMVGKRIISAYKLTGTGTHAGIYAIGIGRASDPVAANDWIYVLFYNANTASGTVTAVRVFYM